MAEQVQQANPLSVDVNWDLQVQLILHHMEHPWPCHRKFMVCIGYRLQCNLTNHKFPATGPWAFEVNSVCAMLRVEGHCVATSAIFLITWIYCRKKLYNPVHMETPQLV